MPIGLVDDRRLRGIYLGEINGAHAFLAVGTQLPSSPNASFLTWPARSYAQAACQLCSLRSDQHALKCRVAFGMPPIMPAAIVRRQGTAESRLLIR